MDTFSRTTINACHATDADERALVRALTSRYASCVILLQARRVAIDEASCHVGAKEIVSRCAGALLILIWVQHRLVRAVGDTERSKWGQIGDARVALALVVAELDEITRLVALAPRNPVNSDISRPVHIHKTTTVAKARVEAQIRH